MQATLSSVIIFPCKSQTKLMFVITLPNDVMKQEKFH